MYVFHQLREYEEDTVRPSLTAEMADMVVQERVTAAERFRRQREAKRPASEPDQYQPLPCEWA